MLTKTKNRKQQSMPLSKTITKIFHEYLVIRKGEPDDFLFCNEYGQQLTTRGLQSAIRIYNNRRGVRKSSLHLMRHYFATQWLRNGGDWESLRKLLGHSTMKMVMKYVHICDEDIRENFNEYNPLEGFNIERKSIKMRK